MSTGGKISRAKAEQIAKDFTSLIADVTKSEVCGSIRRNRPMVGDIEIVALPEDRRLFLARLDHLILDGTCRKAMYGDSLSGRWGDTYRGLMFEDVKIEVFCATADNYGYIKWLRTGPGDANTHVMTRISQTNWPVRFRGGNVWHVEDDQFHKLDAATEDLIFAYIGLDYVIPEQRSISTYGRVCQSRLDAYFLREHWLEDTTPKQASMF